MRYLVLIALMAISLSAHAMTNFGTGADKSKLVAIDAILADTGSYMDKTVTISVRIDGVCKKAGCWMEFVTDDNQHAMRVKVKDGVMVFPVSAKGKTGYATGTLTTRELNLKQTRSYFKREARKKGEAFDPSTITETHTILELKPVGVTIED
jgi:hypothetical protein